MPHEITLASIHRVNSDDRFCGGRARRADLEGKVGVVYLPLTFLRLVRGPCGGSWDGLLAAEVS
jgi:hypothetical protein